MGAVDDGARAQTRVGHNNGEGIRHVTALSVDRWSHHSVLMSYWRYSQGSSPRSPGGTVSSNSRDTSWQTNCVIPRTVGWISYQVRTLSALSSNVELSSSLGFTCVRTLRLLTQFNQ